MQDLHNEKMYYPRKAVTTTTVLMSLVIVIFYYNNIYNLIGPSPENFLKQFKSHNILRNQLNDTEQFLIDTPGCAIPNYMKSLNFKETNFINRTCDERMVFIERVSDYEITFRIDYNRIEKQKGQISKCAYRFASLSNKSGKADNHLTYSKLKSFKNGDIVKLEEEIIMVSCELSILKNSKIKKISTYKDAYLILKKKKTNYVKDQLNWNVLLVGMDTMSRARAYHSIPKTVKYLQANGWLDYRGYQKIGENTFPNLMAVLSGKNSSSSRSDCWPGMDQCEHTFIWNKFKTAGYMTAFGEDYLKLPDTFSIGQGFTTIPTDHYARPFFLIGEYARGNILCTQRKSSAQHLLDYALQFSEVYKNVSFFGHFWINSYSHNLLNLPRLIEEDLINFFEGLKSKGNLDNTFVFFLSDHGIRFGPQRIPIESYYEERLPMMFIWVPYDFKETYPVEYDYLQLNQYRLTTPYDLHATLNYLMNANEIIDTGPPEACPQCASLTTPISPLRTCADAQVDMKWCSCHTVTKSTQDDATAKKCLDLAVQYVQYRANNTKTTTCTMCKPLNLDKVLRNDWYKNGSKTYYIVAFQMKPGYVGFEATVEIDGDRYTILEPTTTISSYNIRGTCTLNKFQKPFCVCSKTKKCAR